MSIQPTDHEQDTADRTDAELLDRERIQTLELIAAGRPVKECLAAVVESAVRLVPNAIAAGVVVEAGDNPTGELAVFHPPTIGSVLDGEPPDEQACHSTPVQGRDGRPVGTFRLWLPEPRPATQWEARVAATNARIAGIVLERERAAAELLQSQERFSVAADVSGTVVYDIDFSPGADGSAVVYGLEHVVGEPAKGPVSTAEWRSWVHPDDVPNHEALVAGSIADPSCSSYQNEYRVRHRDGSWRDVEEHARIRRGRDGRVLRIIGTLRDITLRKRGELDLQRSREQLALLSDTVPALISYIGIDRRYRTCNAEYANWFGMSREEIVGKSMQEVLGPRAWRVIRPHVEQAFAGEFTEYEAEVVYRHGGRKWIHARYMPHRPAGGEVVGVVCLVTDISARRRTEHERSRLAAIVNSSEDAIIGKSLDGTIVSFNEGAVRLFGYSAEEAVGQPITMLIPEERHHEETKILDRIRHGQSVPAYETVRRRRDGSLFDISLSVSPIVDETGAILGASSIARDITARKRAEEDVRRSREALNGLVDRAPFGIYIVDSQLKIVQMNARSQAGVFYNVRPIIGRDLAEVLRSIWPEPVATEVVDAFRHTLATGESYRSRNFMSARIDTDNVESYEWELHAITLPDGERGIVCYYFDSTRLRKAEQGLREADRRKDEFLATLAHELRNPLAPIRNGLQILRMTAGRDPAAAARVQEMLERQVNHLVRLVDDLMEVARVTRGRIELRKEVVDLAGLLRSAVDTSKPLIEAGRHRLTIDLPESPVTLVADPVRLAQIVANLLNNAAKYTEEGGNIVLSARREDGHAVVSVRDSGIGIPVDLLPRVFDLFAQADRTYQRAQGGLGIGLTLVRTLVELHGGTVEAKSEGVGRGSEFIVRLPLSDEHEKRQNAALDVDKARAFAAHRILVVDDSRDAAESLALLLSSMGADVHTATDGPSALDQLDVYRPSVMLLDIGMPGMDGLEVARRARQRPDRRDLTVIALTGWGQDEDRRRSREAGIDYHLVKPVDLDELGRLLAALAQPKASPRVRLS